MKTRSFLYVSNCLLPAAAQQTEVARIVAVALNGTLHAGLLGLWSSQHFAVVLEESTGAIDDLMASILADERHAGVDVLEVRGEWRSVASPPGAWPIPVCPLNGEAHPAASYRRWGRPDPEALLRSR